MNLTRSLLRTALAIGAAFTAISSAVAQQSAFQSSSGQTSLYLQSGSAVSLNFGDTKLSFGQYFRRSDRGLVLGYEVFGKASAGATTLFSSKIKVPEGGADLVIGWHQTIDPNKPLPTSNSTTDQWALLDVGYSRSSFYVADTAVSPDKAKSYFDRFRVFGVYNRIHGRWIFGAGFGAERRNNLDDLKQVTFQTTLIPAAANTSTSIVKSQSGFLGVYGEYIAAPIYTDTVFIVPKAKVPGFDKTGIALDGFTRSDLAVSHRSADGGLGIFVVDSESPTKVRAGIAGSWNGGKVKVALIASYTF